MLNTGGNRDSNGLDTAGLGPCSGAVLEEINKLLLRKLDDAAYDSEDRSARQMECIDSHVSMSRARQ